jgi:hypothetical protein
MTRTLKSCSAVLFLCSLGLVLGLRAIGAAPVGSAAIPDRPGDSDRLVSTHASAMIEEGRRTFRFDTFGDEHFWGDTLRIHQAIAGAALGGVGPGVTPRTALGVGLKVDVSALPRGFYHDGRFATLDLVVGHYDTFFALGLSAREKSDLVQYLESL